MKLLFAIDNLRHGGAQKVLRALLRRLDRERVEPFLWRLGGGSEIEAWFEDLGVPILAYPEWQMRTGVGPGRMLAWMLRHRPVLVQTFLFHADIAGRVLGRLARVPAIVSSVRATNVDKRAWQLGLDRLTARMADRVIAVSSATRDFAVAHEGCPPDRTVVIPNGIDLAEYVPGHERAAARAELGYGDDDFVIGTVGRFHEQKGHRYLVEALRRIAPDRPNVRGFFVGYGPLEDELRRHVRDAGLAERVKVLGYRRDIPRLLAAMDLFALPSLWEGMSNALLESMAMALPAVATAVDGNLEVVENGVSGVLCPPRDAEALAEALAEMAQRPDAAAEMGRRARERAESRFSLERTVDAYIDLYEDLLARKTGRRVRLREPDHG